jgi:hypothetical protein
MREFTQTEIELIVLALTMLVEPVISDGPLWEHYDKREVRALIKKVRRDDPR